MLGLALALAVWAVWDRRSGLADGLHRLPVASIVVSSVCAVGAVVSTLFVWCSVLAGFGAKLGRSDSARVYFLGQMAKYIPGSVWSVLLQMELGRRRNVDRTTMLAASTLTLAIGVGVGGIIACGLLPFVSSRALHHFWWLLVLVPPAVCWLHPRPMSATINWVLRRAHRQPLTVFPGAKAELKAAGWAALSWVFLGGHVYALVAGLGATGIHAAAASVAAGCLAVSAGIVLIPVPAGAGVREVVFVITLAPVLSSSSGLLVALLSRVILIMVDVLMAGASVVPTRWARGGSRGSPDRWHGSREPSTEGISEVPRPPRQE